MERLYSNPKSFLALVQTDSTCGVQERSEDRMTPRYLKVSEHSSGVPSSKLKIVGGWLVSACGSWSYTCTLMVKGKMIVLDLAVCGVTIFLKVLDILLGVNASACTAACHQQIIMLRSVPGVQHRLATPLMLMRNNSGPKTEPCGTPGKLVAEVRIRHWQLLFGSCVWGSMLKYVDKVL